MENQLEDVQIFLNLSVGFLFIHCDRYMATGENIALTGDKVKTQEPGRVQQGREKTNKSKKLLNK